MIKAIIFDFDETLVETFRIRSRALQECGKLHYGLDLTEADIRSFWGLPFAEFIRRLYKTAEPDAEIIRKYFAVAQKYPLKLFPGVKELLLDLAKQYKLAIVSASSSELINFDFYRFKLPKATFFKIQGSEATNFHKPDPRVFEPLLLELQELEITNDEVLYVGDSLSDLKAAQGVGFNFVPVVTGQTTAAEFRARGAVGLNKLTELPQYLSML